MRNIKLLLFIVTALQAQSTIEGNPLSMEYNLSNEISVITMPEFDLDAMLLEDATTSPGTPFRYGKIFYVDYNLNN